MPKPWTYRHASPKWRAFLGDVKDRLSRAFWHVEMAGPAGLRQRILWLLRRITGFRQAV